MHKEKESLAAKEKNKIKLQSEKLPNYLFKFKT